ncbi:LacI family DNA-binding transcriptional regulator [Arthrobacter sp. SA17]
MVAMPHPTSPAKPAVTRDDVARRAGVSPAVVSYVVNGGPRPVSPANEAKVRQAIKALGYRPNSAARALALGSCEMLAMIVPDAINPFYASLARAVENAAAERGYTPPAGGLPGLVTHRAPPHQELRRAEGGRPVPLQRAVRA